MKKAITITFGLIGLIFGLVFTSIKINGAEITQGVYTYYGRKYENQFQIFSDDLKNQNETNDFITYIDFLDRWDTKVSDNAIAVLNFTNMYVEYEDNNNINYSYWGNSDMIIINKINTSLYNFEFWSYGELKATFQTTDILPPSNPFVKMTTAIETSYQNGYEAGLYDGYADAYQEGYDQGYLVGMEGSDTGYGEGYNKGYEIGYRKGKYDGQLEGFDEGWQGGLETGKEMGFKNGYQEGISTVYENGFGGFINPDTNQPYDETASFPYGKGYQDSITSTESGGLWNVLFSAILAPFQVLGIELLPGVTIGMIVAVPLVFGLLAWILSAGKAKK